MVIISECDKILAHVRDFYALKKYANKDQMDVVRSLEPIFEKIKRSAEDIKAAAL